MQRSLPIFIFMGVVFALLESIMMSIIWQGVPFGSIQNIGWTLISTTIFLLLMFVFLPPKES